MAKVRIPKTNPVKKRILKYLNDSNVFFQSDEEIVDLYVETYEFYQKLREELAESDFLMDYTNKAGAENKVKNPLVVELSKTVQTLNNLLKSLGLTPAQRKALASGGGGDGDDFDKF